MIVKHHLIIIRVSTDSSFDSAEPSYIWKTSLGNGASHAIVITGYHDSKHAYRIMNSWGTAWGDQGSSWVDYDLLPTVSAYYSYVINQ
jgi:C1A family cysteine protease